MRSSAPRSQDRTPASATPRDPSLATNYRESGLVHRRKLVIGAGIDERLQCTGKLSYPKIKNFAPGTPRARSITDVPHPETAYRPLDGQSSISPFAVLGAVRVDRLRGRQEMVLLRHRQPGVVHII